MGAGPFQTSPGAAPGTPAGCLTIGHFLSEPSVATEAAVAFLDAYGAPQRAATPAGEVLDTGLDDLDYLIRNLPVTPYYRGLLRNGGGGRRRLLFCTSWTFFPGMAGGDRRTWQHT